jgi:fatty-acyl-CoA synthase
MRTVATVGDLVALAARRDPGRVAVRERWSGRTCTFAELDERTTRLANGLLGSGLTPGDRIAAWMEDGVEYVELYLATAKAGLVIVPVNARYRAAEARHLVEDSGSRMLVSTGGLAAEVDALGFDGTHLVAPGADGTPPSVGRARDGTGRGAATGAGRGRSGPGGPGQVLARAWEALVTGGAPRRPPAPDPDALYVLGYTSGTTGPPKGAMLTHRSVLAIARSNTIAYRLPLGGAAALTGSMSFVSTVPAHILTHLYTGGTNVLMGRWDVEDLLAVVAEERATFTYLPGPLIGDFCAVARDRPADWASLQSILHSASRAEPAKLRELCDVVGSRFVEGWGMTENSGGLMTATTRRDVEDGDPRTWEGVGRPVAEVLIEVRGPDGERLPHDGTTVGELVFRGPALMDGYHGRPDATAEALRDGWFHSGDLGTVDPDGYVAISERRTDLIVSGGMNVYPGEVEDCIAGIPGVAECAVVGVPHERWGQTVVAVVVAEDGARPDAEAVIDRCRERLASYKKPTSVVFRDALPRTVSLKVRRGEVREQLLADLGTPGPNS